MRPLFKRQLKLISKAIDNFEKESSKQNSLSIAGIHATILSIIIATLSIIVMYNFNLLREKESEVFKEADKINNLNFAVSYVYPPADFPFPENADDSEKLAACIFPLVNCIS